MFQRELEFAWKIFDSGTKFAFGKRGQLVEERLDYGRVKDNHDELEADPVQFNIVKRLILGYGKIECLHKRH